MPELPDIVYITSANEINDELRHSLRSLANLPHRHVWLVGYKPRWVTNVGYLPQYQRGTKHENTWANWLAAARHDQISSQFVLFNDDFYVTRPIDGVTTLHRGPLEQAEDHYRQWRAEFYYRRTVHTRGLLHRAGVAAGGPLYSYELHVPMVVDRELLLLAAQWLETNRQRPGSIAKRTWYGNWAAVGGEQAQDVKVQGADHGLPDTPLPYLSTSPQSWRGRVGGWLRQQFPTPCNYETAGQTAARMYRPATRGASRA